MEHGSDKCAVVHFERGRVVHSYGVNVDTNRLWVLSKTEKYRSLGMSLAIGEKEADVTKGVCKIFLQDNKIRVYNYWVKPVLDLDRVGRYW